MISLVELSRKLSPTGRKKWIWLGIAAVPALRLYYVREMIAALMIFSVLFFAVGILALVVLVLDGASRQIVAWAEPAAARAAHWISGTVEGMSATQLRAPAVAHRSPAQLKRIERS